jgi:hypothetical protein
MKKIITLVLIFFLLIESIHTGQYLGVGGWLFCFIYALQEFKSSYYSQPKQQGI